MVHKHTPAAPASFPPIPLFANSYNLAELEKATIAAEKHADHDKRYAEFGKIARDQALNQQVIDSANAPAMPEGHELGDVESVTGGTVRAPILAKAGSGEPDRDKSAPQGDGNSNTKG